MNEAQSTDSLAQARERLGHSLNRLDEVRTDLVEIVENLPLPPSDPEDVAEPPLAGVYELDALIRCALHDHLKPLIRDLRKLLVRPGEAEE